MPDLNTLWFILVGVLFTGYAMLDGFDLGVGALHLFTRKDEHRRMMLNAIGPVWDGNEVWLVTGGGALFAAFPEVYATVFSGFYIPFMMLLGALIFRAVSIEFRSKEPMRWWRRMWDFGFAGGSILSSLLIGIAMGNVVWGVPLDEDFEFAGTFVGMLHPYALLCGVTTLALFMMHGSIYVVMKTEGELQQMAKRWTTRCSWFFVACFILFNIATVVLLPHIRHIIVERPYTVLFLVLCVLSVFNVPREHYHERVQMAFISSCAAMIFLMLLFACAMYPYLLYGVHPSDSMEFGMILQPMPELDGRSMSIYNSSSTQPTLRNMLIIAMIGVPIVLAYTVSIYWIFRGKVEINEDSY